MDTSHWCVLFLVVYMASTSSEFLEGKHKTAQASVRVNDLWCYACDTMEDGDRCSNLSLGNHSKLVYKCPESEIICMDHVLVATNLYCPFCQGRVWCLSGFVVLGSMVKSSKVMHTLPPSSDLEVKRYSYTTSTENSTSVLRTWSMERNCTSRCEPGCIIIGERTKLYACTTCCETSLCNTGRGAGNSVYQPTRIVTLLVVTVVFHLITFVLIRYHYPQKYSIKTTT